MCLFREAPIYASGWDVQLGLVNICERILFLGDWSGAGLCIKIINKAGVKEFGRNTGYPSARFARSREGGHTRVINAAITTKPGRPKP